MEQNIPLSDIVRHPALQVRERLDNDWVTELTDLYRGNHEIAAVEVVFDGARYLLTDGWHRIEAQQRAWGASAVIAAEVIDANTTDDPMSIAKTRAAMGNRAGGLRRSDGDKRRQVLLLRSTPKGRAMTHDEIAKRVGVTRQRVSQILSGENSASICVNSKSEKYGGARADSVAALWAQIDAALQADKGRADTHIAQELKCTRDVVAARRGLLGLPKSDATRWKDTSQRDAMIEDLRRDPEQGSLALAKRYSVSTASVAKAREGLGLPRKGAGGRIVGPASSPSVTKAGVQKLVGVIDRLTAPPSAPINPKRTDDPREQGAEVLPSRPPPSRKPDIVTEVMQRLECASPIDRQAVVVAIWNRWPHLIKNALEEEREDTMVLQ